MFKVAFAEGLRRLAALYGALLTMASCAVEGGDVTRWMGCAAVLASQFFAAVTFAAPRFPLAGRVRFEHANATCQFGTEPWPTGVFDGVDRDLRSAYRGAAERMFRRALEDEPADVEIDVSDACAEIVHDIDGTRIEIDVHARIVAGGSELDRLSVRSEEHVYPGEQVATASERAVEGAARNLEVAFVDSEPVVAWLMRRNIKPVGSTVIWPRRGDPVIFADVSGGMLVGAGEDSAISMLAHVGVARRWLMVQGVVGTWAPSIMASPSDSGNKDVRVETSLRTFDVGIEAGPRLRLGPAWELRGGAGAHLLFGSADVSPRQGASSFTRLSPAVFAALQTSQFPSISGRRVRFGVEVRKHFWTIAALPELSRTVPAGGLGIAAYLGFEWPRGGSDR